MEKKIEQLVPRDQVHRAVQALFTHLEKEKENRKAGDGEGKKERVPLFEEDAHDTVSLIIAWKKIPRTKRLGNRRDIKPLFKPLTMYEIFFFISFRHPEFSSPVEIFV